MNHTRGITLGGLASVTGDGAEKGTGKEWCSWAF